MTFGSWIKEKKEEKGFTSRKVADALEISKSYLSDIERGYRSAPDYYKLKKLAGVLQLSPNEYYNMLDLAGDSKGDIPIDIKVYMFSHRETYDLIRNLIGENKDLDSASGY